MSEIVLSHNPDRTRYEASVDGTVAGFAAYRLRDELVVFHHTEVEAAYEGKGVGSRLARYALDDVRSQGRRVRPDCPFIKAWIDRHPDYAGLVADTEE